jgi:hypothetical protein
MSIGIDLALSIIYREDRIDEDCGKYLYAIVPSTGSIL